MHKDNINETNVLSKLVQQYVAQRITDSDGQEIAIEMIDPSGRQPNEHLEFCEDPLSHV